MRPTALTAPEASFLDKERLDHLRGAMDQLSETGQRIVVLREFEGLSYREIGERMQLSSAAVESALFRARRKLEHEYEQIYTGRRCALMRAVIARMAEGVGSGRDRRRLERHARSCWPCRRRANELGVRAGRPQPRSRRAGAFLPLPGFLHLLLAGPRSGQSGARDAAGALSGPAAETVVQGVHKAAVVLASAIAIAGGGATLGGVGPLAPGGEGRVVERHGHGVTAPGEAPQPAPRKQQSTQRSRGRDRDEAADGAKSGRAGPPGAESPAPGGPSAPGHAPGAPGQPAGGPAARTDLQPGARPGVPSLPGVPRPAAPRLPSLPDTSTLPDTSARPGLPQVPEVPEVGLLPNAGLVPDTSEVTAPRTGLLPLP